ncbi:hypothetical protein RISK_002413 [Rhodopirellula islandica]|uniref:Uncharacterized protein n=1 Tax=Rhodopirellula islandica TaxID=595434 RepID=A0A0J1BGX9_RHOIS|nr:hypothetical protein RISK_002413 [Rhodopirellula islandica]
MGIDSSAVVIPHDRKKLGLSTTRPTIRPHVTIGNGWEISNETSGCSGAATPTAPKNADQSPQMWRVASS